MFELVIRDSRVELPLQAQRVLAHLAVVQPVQPRSVLAGSLWSDMPQERAMATLRNALWRLRKTSPLLVHASRDSVGLGSHVWLDLEYLRKEAAALEAGAPPDPVEPPFDLLEAELLAGWDEDWLHVERERLRQLRVHALEAMAEGLLRQGLHAQAIQAALAAIRAEPLRETAQAALIRAHLSEGNTAEAVRQLEAFRRLLADELGLRPSARVEALLDGSAEPASLSAY
jgi:DNA-binding SARP family transcriptional activator